MKKFIKTLSTLFSILIIISVLTPALNVNAEENVYSGTTGDCSWEFNPDTKTITISGEGDMDNYFGSVETPWYSYKDEIENVRFEGEIYSIGEWTFAGFKSIKNIEFCDSIETIKERAFSGCDSLEEVKFNSGLRVIDDNAFDYCSNLKKIDLPDSLVAVYTFNYCDSLTEVELPINVSYVAWSFKNCKSLKKVYLHHNLKHITENCFIGCDNLTDVFYYGTEKEWKNIQFDIDVIKSLNLYYLRDTTHTNGCAWSFDDTTSTLTISGNNRVLEYVNGQDVPWKSYCSIAEKVVFSEGIKYIGKCLHSFISLKSIVLPDSLKRIQLSAFMNAPVDEIEIPENVTRIDTYAFCYSENLKKVIIRAKIESIPDQVFLRCYSLKEITIPKSVKEIGYNTFCDCDSLSDIYYEGTEEEWNKINVNEKGNDALKSATIHYEESAPYKILSGTTGGCEWKLFEETDTLYISGQGQMDDYNMNNLPPWYEFKYNIKKVVFENGVENIGEFSFYNCENLKDVVFSNSINSIGCCAFQDCSSLESVNINNNVRSIGYGTFSNCTSLKSIHLPVNLGGLPNGVFKNLPKLESIYIPYNTRAMYDSFVNCPSLTTVYLTSKTRLVNSLSVKSFTNCDNIKDVYYYGKLTDENREDLANETAFLNATFHYIDEIPYEDEGDSAEGTTGDCIWKYDSKTRTLTISGNGNMEDYYDLESIPWNNYSDKIITINFENGVKYVGRQAFPFYTALEKINFSDSVESIGDYAFQSCSSIEYVDIGKNVKSIGAGAFSFCQKLKEFNLPPKITYLSSWLEGCKFTSFKINDHIKTIGHGAFEYCYYLKNISFGKNVKAINSSAFGSCRELTDVYFMGSEEEWNNIVIDESGNKYLLNATVHFNEEMPTEYPERPTDSNSETITPSENIETTTTTEPVETTLPPTTAGPTTEPIVTTIPPTTAEFTTEPIETTLPPTTAEFTTEPIVTTLPPTTAEPTTEPVETTLPPTTAEPITEPVETTLPPTTAEPTTEPIETTLPPTTAEFTTEPIVTTLPPTTAEFTTEPVETTEPVTQLESTLTPVITPITIPSVVTEPTESPRVKVKKVPQRISAKSYNKQNGDDPFKIKAKAKGKLSFSTKSKAVKLDKDGNVTIKTAGVAVIKISAASTSKYKSAIKSIKIVIRPKPVKLTRAKGTEKKYTIYFKKQKGVSGYELRYKPVGSKKWKTVTASKSASYFTIKNLKYVKHTVRASAYIKDGKKKIYGKYNQKFFGPK